ncbi:BTB/POZ domain-containing protein 6-like [Mercenaria mercenaria]|uniref:BTB/POZ domain-containing protein 6-like n=1 Tax=Mercenaria mercenaria TaxID=6596 RepID=UPI00234FA922|nr:BTB/POZ domain-containing protein 6-like [Mercenaria mercenaria]
MTTHTLTTAWQNQRSFEETNLQMLQNEVLCDVTFLVGSNKQEIKAHKFLLASRSQMFYSMFCSSPAETHDAIQVPDIEHEVMKTILRYIYTEDCEINTDSVMAILLGAKKYKLSRLEEKCRTFLTNRLTADNVCTILKNVHDLEEKELEQKCLSFIMERGDDALNADGLTALPKTAIRKIITSDNLQAEESTVYGACKRWAVEKCRQETGSADFSSADLRNQLGDLLHLIRFPLMTFETFASSASKDDILTADEKVSIFNCIANKSTSSDCKFSMKKRTGIFKIPAVKEERLIIKRFLNAPSREWMYNGLPDSISFKVSVKAKFLGVSLFSPINAGKIKGILKLQQGTTDILYEKNIEINYSPTKISEEVILDNNVDIVPGQLYTLYTKLTGGYTYYGTGGQTTVSAGNIDVSFAGNDFSLNGTDSTEGQFNYIILKTVSKDR